MSDNLINFKEFTRKFKYVKDLGRGGGGCIKHVYNEIMDAHFAIKKYEPHDNNKDILSYDKFLEEIRLLYHMDHPNIVRIYNYYEYQNSNVAYIQMEYVDGRPITECIYDTSLDWNRIFQESINAFKYLEEKGILHRDIRPANILINNSGNVKIIDFGFGKEVVNGNDGTNQNSIVLNWFAPEPNEVKNKGKYCHATDIYYLGYLFIDIVTKIDNFKYKHIVEKMIKYNEEDRYKSFNLIYEEIVSNTGISQEFLEEDANVYLEFARAIDNVLIEHYGSIDIHSKETIEENLSYLLTCSMLENYIQSNEMLLRCFLANKFNVKSVYISTDTVRNFYQLWSKMSDNKKDIIINHLRVRFSKKFILPLSMYDFV